MMEFCSVGDCVGFCCCFIILQYLMYFFLCKSGLMTSIVCISDWSSTDHSLPVDDFQLSDEEDSPVQHTEINLMNNMVKHTKPESFFDPKGQKMMVCIIEHYRSV